MTKEELEKAKREYGLVTIRRDIGQIKESISRREKIGPLSKEDKRDYISILNTLYDMQRRAVKEISKAEED